MLIIKNAADLSQILQKEDFSAKIIGFVPTMGALHNGNISLLKAAQEESELTIVSIFVNPTQFNKASDFEKYPITTSQDVELLTKAGCDILYLPSVEDIYPNGTDKLTHYTIDNLDIKLEGEFRPGHFQGVCNVVDILLQQVQPDFIFMGAKDFQQCKVVKKLLQVTASKTQIKICPTMREESGLAMSSRNKRLSEEGKITAAIIYKCLSILTTQTTTSFEENKKQTDAMLVDAGLELEYTILAEADSLDILENYSSEKTMVVLFAAWLEGVRLIDNIEFSLHK
jgi:pantoate--beta-alanine ligase